MALQHPNVNLTDLIKLNKMHLPVNENNLFQMRNYQNMEHKLLDGIREASDEILKLYETLTGNQSLQGVQTGAGNIIANGMQGAVQGQAALENGAKFMEQVLVLLAGEEGQGENMQASGNTANGQNVSANTENSGAMTEADSNLNPSANLEEKNARSSLDWGNLVSKRRLLFRKMQISCRKKQKFLPLRSRQLRDNKIRIRTIPRQHRKIIQQIRF